MTVSEIIDSLSTDFKNIVKVDRYNPTYNYCFKVVDSIGNESAELYYSEAFNEWAIILDNFPSQRKHYSWTLPLKNIETLKYILSLCGIELLIVNKTK